MLQKFIIGFCFSALSFAAIPAHADEGFPFGLEMTLDVSPMPGSKRRPTLEIGEAGETRVELWCKGGKGQFSVAGDTVVFGLRVLDNRVCSPALAQADDVILMALSGALTWRRRDDVVSFAGGHRPLQFRINTN